MRVNNIVILVLVISSVSTFSPQQPQSFLEAEKSCDNRCETESANCRKDSLCSKAIQDCSRKFARDLLEGYPMSASKTAYTLCLRNSKNPKAVALFNCMAKTCTKSMMAIRTLEHEFDDQEHISQFEASVLPAEFENENEIIN